MTGQSRRDEYEQARAAYLARLKSTHPSRALRESIEAVESRAHARELADEEHPQPSGSVLTSR